MILVNGNVDVKTHPKINPAWLMNLIGDLSPVNLYISLVARNEDIKTLVRKTKDGIFLRLVLPYEEVIVAEDTKTIVIDTLLKELHRLERYEEVDVEELRKGIRERFGIEIVV